MNENTPDTIPSLPTIIRAQKGRVYGERRNTLRMGQLEALRSDRDLLIRLSSNLYSKIKDLDDPGEVALGMVECLMRELRIDSGGVVQVTKSGKFKLIDIIKIIHDEVRRYSDNEEIDLLPPPENQEYFEHLKEEGDIIICPTDDLGADAFINLHDKKGDRICSLFLDQTDNAVNLSNYIKSLISLKEIWQKIYEKRLKKYHEEKRKLSLKINKLSERIYQAIRIQQSSPDRQNIVEIPKENTKKRKQENEDNDSFDDYHNALTNNKTTLEKNIQDTIRETVSQALAIVSGNYDEENLNNKLIHNIQNATTVNLLEKREDFTEIVESELPMHEIIDRISEIIKRDLLKTIRYHLKIAQLQEESETDYLTGLLSRRRFDEELRKEFIRCERSNTEGVTFSLLYLDLDRFKEVNDSFGHSSGDRVLKGVAQCLKQEVREYDSVARLSGDEFAIILPDTSRFEARDIAFRLSRSVKRLNIKGIDDITISMSIGIANFRKNIQKETEYENVGEMTAEADKMLYFAKKIKGGGVAMDRQIIFDQND